MSLQILKVILSVYEDYGVVAAFCCLFHNPGAVCILFFQNFRCNAAVGLNTVGVVADHKNLSSIIEKDLLTDPGLDKTLLGDGIGSLAGAFFGGPEALRIVGLVVVAVFGLWGLWWILTTPRRTRALGYALESNHLMARRGIVFRSMSSMPYGRIQYVDVDSGPLERMCGVARLTVRTAGTTTGTMVLFGIPLNVAEELRADLVRRADERMAAL